MIMNRCGPSQLGGHRTQYSLWLINVNNTAKDRSRRVRKSRDASVKGLAARHLVKLGFSRALSRADVRNRVRLMGRRRRRGARASSALIAANSFSMARADGAPSVSFRRVVSASELAHNAGRVHDRPRVPAQRDRRRGGLASPSHAMAIASRSYAALAVYWSPSWPPRSISSALSSSANRRA